ncbi:hypothetical protein [Trueperella bernardiae]|uniref:hypothetical protein n=1 Tax=Trueperella bernardiae TaxID=59561 RepID=UPI00288B5F6A|nr:hypothetical protein [Trueperella bernardiae]
MDLAWLRSHVRLWALALFAFTVSMLLVFPRVSFALDGEEESAGGTKAYEIEVQWKNQPEQVTSGLDVLSMIWWMDINDSAPAPGNEPTTDNLLVVTVENAHFGEIPSQCLSGDAGKSALSEDACTLTCDIGTRDQGTAQMVLSGVEMDGPAGSNVKAKAQFRGLEATLPEIPIIAPFIMDAKFDGGPVVVDGRGPQLPGPELPLLAGALGGVLQGPVGGQLRHHD